MTTEKYKSTYTGVKIDLAIKAALEYLTDGSSVSQFIQSSNYVAGSAGWKIGIRGSNDGFAEFSDITIRGTITATAGDIGGWNVVSGYLYSLASGTPTSTPSDGLVLASGNEAVIVYENTEKRVELGYLSSGVYGLKVYADDGSTVIFEASDTQRFFGAGMLGTGSEISIQGWTHDMIFSVTDADTVAWGSGTITLMNGDTYSIDAGNTGNMTVENYIYLDIGTSTTVLQSTTTKTTAIGSGKIMIAICENNTGEATFAVFGSVEQNIDANVLRAASITVTEIANNAIEEAKVAADAITAAKIAVSGLDGTTGDVAANHIIAGMIQTNAVTSIKIQADAVTAAKINVVGLNGTTGRIIVADATDANVVTGGINTYAATLIQAGKIVISGATNLEDWRKGGDLTKIDGGSISTGTVTATQILANTITANEILANTITASEVAAGTITATEIATGTITIGQIADGNTSVTFFQAGIPVALSSGDIWVDSDDGNKPYRATTAGDDQITAGEWVAVPDATIATAQTTADTAEANAQTGISNAATAQGLLDDIADDEKITSLEKLTIKPIWDDIVVEGTATTGTIPTQATAFSVADTNFDTAYATLYAYIVTSLNTFGSMTTTTTITRSEWDNAWKGYYTQRTQLLNAIATAAKALADTAQGAADDAQGDATDALTNAQTAQDAADAAQGDATTAVNALVEIAADTKITPVEKLTLKPIWDAVVVEGTATTGTIPTQATLFSVADTDFDTIYATLYAYVITSLDTFGNMATTTTITRATWDAAWLAYYGERTNLLNDIAAAAKTLADTAESNAQTGISNAATAQGTAEGKINSFRQSGIPTAIAAGDIWIDSDDDKIYRATSIGDDAIGGGEWILQDAGLATGWSHGSDVTKIDGGDIYTNTITAAQITVNNLSSLSAAIGTVTSGTVIGATIKTAASGRRVQIDNGGIRFITGATTGKYGTNFKYGDGTKYGTGFLAYFYNTDSGMPFYVQSEQTIADMHLFNRSSTPSGVAEIGDLCVVLGKLSICTVAGTPGTWVVCGDQAA